MCTLAHISDLHFGAIIPEVAAGLKTVLTRLRPDIVVVSGDLTQRARASQFRAARTYLDQLPFPQMIVPGNHDIPLFNLAARFLLPLQNYRKYITADLSPFFQDQNMAVQGISTARSLTWKNGRISESQIQQVYQRMIRVPDTAIKILVTHHPFLPPPQKSEKSIVGRASETLRLLEACNLDILLAGHFHMSYSGKSHAVHITPRRAILVVQAGTAASSRTFHHQNNAFNLIRLEKKRIHIDVYVWDGRTFIREKTEPYWLSSDRGWEPALN